MLVENISSVNECSAELPFILQSTRLDGKHSYGSWKNVLMNMNMVKDCVISYYIVFSYSLLAKER